MPSSLRLRSLAIATALACPLFFAGLFFDSLALRLPAKPWPHLLLIAWILDRQPGLLRLGSGPSSGAELYARRIVVALAVCMTADVLLEFRQTLFTHGIATFLVGQLTLASAFTLRCRQARPLAALPFVTWLVAAYLAIAPGLGDLALPVMGYMAAIGIMLWRAAAWTAADRDSTGWSPSRLALAGAVVFAVSDTMIAFDRFHAPFAGARYLIITTYWAALALIAASAVRETRPGRN